jgi:hypothetical protein
MYNVTEEKLIHVKDIGVPEPALGVAVDGSYICAALRTQYTVYNFDTNFSQQLFTYGSEDFLPIIRRITKVGSQTAICNVLLVMETRLKIHNIFFPGRISLECT